MPKKKEQQLSALQQVALPIAVGEARKLLGPDAHTMSDDDIIRQVLLYNDLAIYLSNNMDLHKMHL